MGSESAVTLHCKDLIQVDNCFADFTLRPARGSGAYVPAPGKAPIAVQVGMIYHTQLFQARITHAEALAALQISIAFATPATLYPE